MGTTPQDDLLKEFEDLIRSVGKQVALESVNPTLSKIITTWDDTVRDATEKLINVNSNLVQMTSKLEAQAEKIPDSTSHLVSATETVGLVTSDLQRCSKELDRLVQDLKGTLDNLNKVDEKLVKISNLTTTAVVGVAICAALVIIMAR